MLRAHLSDETWRQLDPYAGSLTRRQVRHVALASVVGALVLALAVAVALSGLVVPRVDRADAGGYGYGYDPDTWHIYHSFEIVNSGRFPVEIVDVGRAGPGLEPVSAAPFAEEEIVETGRLEPGATMRLAVAYRVTDCDAVPEGPWPVPVRVSRPWGTHTARIELPTQSRDHFDLPPDETDNGGVSWRGDVEWQRNLADTVCHYRAGGEPWERDVPPHGP